MFGKEIFMNGHFSDDNPIRHPAGKNADRLRSVPAGPLSPFLEADEIVLWYGQPSDTVVRRSGDRSLAITFAAWLAVAAVLLLSVLLHNTAAGYCGIILLAVTLFTLHSPLVILRYSKPLTHYAVTDKRLLLLIRGRLRRFRGLPYDMLERAVLCMGSGDDGSGSIVFLPHISGYHSLRARYRAKLLSDSILLDAFNDIRGADEVYGIIVKATSYKSTD